MRFKKPEKAEPTGGRETPDAPEVEIPEGVSEPVVSIEEIVRQRDDLNDKIAQYVYNRRVEALHGKIVDTLKEHGGGVLGVMLHAVTKIYKELSEK